MKKNKTARRFTVSLTLSPGLCNNPRVTTALINNAHAPVAQPDRALAYEARGRTFESCRAHSRMTV